jgi:hypothetical protein
MIPPVEGGFSGKCKVQPLWILSQDMKDEASFITVEDSESSMARKGRSSFLFQHL